MAFRFVSLRLAVCILTVGAICACGPKQPAPVQPKTLVVFPPPPDTTRIQFLTRFGGSLDFRKEKSAVKSFLFGGDKDTTGLSIIKPYGVAIHDGTIYVCDTVRPGVDVIDLKARSFSYLQPARGAGALRKPINCAVDDDTGHLYVTDTDQGQVLEYDGQGTFIGALGDARTKPTDVFVTGATVWVTDLATRQVSAYDAKSRAVLRQFPQPDSARSRATLGQPVNLYVRDSLVYVTDFADFDVKIYTTLGRFIRAVGGAGTGHGQLTRPKGIAVDRDHNLFVVDAAFENVQIFDRDGKLLMFFGGTYEGPGYMWLPAKVTIDYDNLEYFQQYVDPRFTLKYLILVTNQYGPDKLSVYGRVEPKAAAPTP